MSEVLISQGLGHPVRAGQAGLTNYLLATSLMYGDTLYLLMDQCGTVLQDGCDEAFFILFTPGMVHNLLTENVCHLSVPCEQEVIQDSYLDYK